MGKSVIHWYRQTDGGILTPTPHHHSWEWENLSSEVCDQMRLKLACQTTESWNFGYNISSHLSPLTSEVVGAPQMMLQQYLSTLPCLPLPLGNLQTPFLSIPWCYLPISSVFLSFLLLSLSPAELSSPCRRILRCGHTIWSFLFFTMVRRSSCTPTAFWILLQTSSFVTWVLTFIG